MSGGVPIPEEAIESASSIDEWCNCAAIPGSGSYPGPWHPEGDPVFCGRFGASVLRGEGQTDG